jgi:hypothetical protein
MADLQKKPDDWKTADDPSTGAQRSYLATLANEANEDVRVEGLTKAGASKEIERLRDKTGRAR